MNKLFCTFLLMFFLTTPVWADSHTNDTADSEPGIKIQIDSDGDETTDTSISEEELERKIEGKVLGLIADVLDATGDRLNEDEKVEIKETIKKVKEEADIHEGIHIGSDGKPFFIEAVLAAMAIFFVFGTPLMIVAAVLYSNYRKKRLMHETIDHYVTSGKDIPPEVLKGLQKEATPKSNLHKGLVMSGIGLGIFACFAVIGSLEAASFGLIPLFIGLAQLLIWKLEK